MSVYIKGMEMPVSCGTCPIRHMVFHVGDECYLGAKITEYQRRPEDCPLIPVPDHGRLGDLDKLKDKAIARSEKCGGAVNVMDMVISAYDIEATPTVIPADKEGDYGE